MKPKMSVILETARYGGLDWQFKLFANQTFQDFELILIDGCWEQRETEIIDLARKLNIKMKYLREQYPFKTEHTRPINVNTCMMQANGDYFVFLDDFHIFPNNFLEEHYKICEKGYAGMVRWDIVKCDGELDYSTYIPTVDSIDPRWNYFMDHKWEFEQYGNWFIGVPWDWWWPNSTSVPRKWIEMVNGFNELYCGGTGSEDNDTAYRMAASGMKFAYNPTITAYHIQHGKISNKSRSHGEKNTNLFLSMRKLKHRIGAPCNYRHDRRPFTKNEYYKDGDPNLIENELLFTWFQDGYKVFQCKHCGEFGAIDGQQMLTNTKNRCNSNIYIPPSKIHFPDGPVYNCTNIK